jgi:hypothetical protein
MDSNILSVVTGAYDLVKSLGMGIINLLSEGKVDVDKLNEEKFKYELAVKNLDNVISQAEIGLTEKIMVNARWTYPMTMITGCSIVLMCLFNIVCLTFGFNKFNIDLFTESFLVLIGMFILCATGSIKLLIKIVEIILEHWSKKQETPKEPVILNEKKDK